MIERSRMAPSRLRGRTHGRRIAESLDPACSQAGIVTKSVRRDGKPHWRPKRWALLCQSSHSKEAASVMLSDGKVVFNATSRRSQLCRHPLRCRHFTTCAYSGQNTTSVARAERQHRGHRCVAQVRPAFAGRPSSPVGQTRLLGSRLEPTCNLRSDRGVQLTIYACATSASSALKSRTFARR